MQFQSRKFVMACGCFALGMAGNRRSSTLPRQLQPALLPLGMAGNRRSSTLLDDDSMAALELGMAGNRRSSTLLGPSVTLYS